MCKHFDHHTITTLGEKAEIKNEPKSPESLQRIAARAIIIHKMKPPFKPQLTRQAVEIIQEVESEENKKEWMIAYNSAR